MLNAGSRRAVRHILGAAVVLLAAVAQAAPQHPLDPLDADEITAAVQATQAAGYGGANTYFPIVRLEEPGKAFVLHWRPGQPLHRRAFLEVFIDQPPASQTHEVVVNLEGTHPAVVSDRQIPGVQPPVLGMEYGVAANVALSDPRFQAGLAARGYGPDSYAQMFCLPLSAGNYGIPAEAGRRLMRVTCLDTSVENPWARPIENLTAVVDLVNQTVIDVVDTGAVPMSRSNGDFYSVPQAPPAKAIQVVSSGDDYSVDGNVVASPRWNFHFRVEPRDGLILDQVKFLDHGTPRSIFYKASLAETFVPYGDPTSNFYYRTYMDEGEYGFGKSTQSLIPNKDCPENARFFDVTLNDDNGNPFTVPNGVCIFEEKALMDYRHFDIFTGQELSRAGRNLVVRYATIVGNYDYYFDWSFHDDGSVHFRVGASGALETKGVAVHQQSEDKTGEATRWGTLIDDGLVGANHQHIFNVRLDMDVDGQDNLLAELTPTVVRANYPGSHRKSGWTVVPTVIEKEGAVDPIEHSQLTVFNPKKKNAVGLPVGYTVEGNNDTTLLMSPDDPPALRAAFTQHELWVTPYDASEVYAAGDYPFMADGTTDGIQNWTQAGRSVAGKDLVLWVNVGFSHIPHSENWPMMVTEWFGEFQLQPFNFFNRNPEDNLSDAQ